MFPQRTSRGGGGTRLDVSGQAFVIEIRRDQGVTNSNGHGISVDDARTGPQYRRLSTKPVLSCKNSV
jgi:hypothetical protein